MMNAPLRTGFARRTAWRWAAVGATLLATSPATLRGQGVDTVTVEQRILMTPTLTPADARRQAIDGALAEAVRRVAGVRVQSTELSTTREVRGKDGNVAVHGGYSSVIQLDATARAVDYRVVDEAWETRRAAGMEPQLYLRLQLTALIERERGTIDPGFHVALALNAARFDVHAGAAAGNDEIVATVQASQSAQLVLFTIADDSAQRLFPNDYVQHVAVASDVATEIPDPEWRARGLRLRASLPQGRAQREEVLMVVALRAAVALPPSDLSLLDLQRWLVRIPLGDRALAVAPYVVRRTP